MASPQSDTWEGEVITTAEKLAVCERLIEDFRWGGRPETHTAEYRSYEVLKSIAADLRGRIETAPTIAEVELERRIKRFRESKTAGGGYAIGPTQALATEVVARWAILKQALEQFGAMAESAEAE